MNLLEKLRAVGGTGERRDGPKEAYTDCRHFAVYREAEEFPGAYDLTAETLRLMSGRELPDGLDPRRILYLDTETTGLGGSGTVAFLVGMGYLRNRTCCAMSPTAWAGSTFSVRSTERLLTCRCWRAGFS